MPLRRLLAAIAVLGPLLAGCGHAGDAAACQVENHSADWFSGSQYDTCMDKFEQARHASAQQERNREACRGGNAAACYDAGLGDRETHEDRALREFETACRADIGGACRQAGQILRTDFFARDHHARALALLLRACDLGDAQGCADAADEHPDPATRVDLGERACERGARAACAKAGDARLASDRERARHLYDLGCWANQHDACAGLDRLRASGP